MAFVLSRLKVMASVVSTVRKKEAGKNTLANLAERQGFEPWDPQKGQRISNPSRSTTPAPLQGPHSLRGVIRHNKPPCVPAWVRLLLIAPLIPVVSACSNGNSSKLEAVKKSGELVVLTRYSPTTYYEGPDGYLGIEYDMTKEFADYLGVKLDRKITRLNSSHTDISRMPSSALKKKKHTS